MKKALIVALTWVFGTVLATSMGWAAVSIVAQRVGEPTVTMIVPPVTSESSGLSGSAAGVMPSASIDSLATDDFDVTTDITTDATSDVVNDSTLNSSKVPVAVGSSTSLEPLRIDSPLTVSVRSTVPPSLASVPSPSSTVAASGQVPRRSAPESSIPVVTTTRAISSGNTTLPKSVRDLSKQPPTSRPAATVVNTAAPLTVATRVTTTKPRSTSTSPAQTDAAATPRTAKPPEKIAQKPAVATVVPIAPVVSPPASTTASTVPRVDQAPPSAPPTPSIVSTIAPAPQPPATVTLPTVAATAATAPSTVVTVAPTTTVIATIATNPPPRPAAYSLANGSVGVHCVGDSTIALDFATPSPGATVKVGNAGPEEIEVAFKGNGKEPSSTLDVPAAAFGSRATDGARYRLSLAKR